MRRLISLLLAVIAAAAILLGAVSCSPAKTVSRGVLSAETAVVGSRLYNASKLSDTFQYIDTFADYKTEQTIEPKIPCTLPACTHSDDSCPAYIRGLTCWVAEPGTPGDLLWYAQMRTYFDPQLKKGVRHNVIACYKVSSGETVTVLQDWQNVIEQLLLYGDDIYFLSKNALGLHDVWVMPKSGGTPELYVASDDADILMVGMEDGTLFYMSEDGGVFRADKDGDAVMKSKILTCDIATGIFVYDGFIYYPVRSKDAPEYELLPGRTVIDENGEEAEVGVAVNCYDYYRMKASGGEPELVITGVQATKGSLCSNGMLYLPAWDFSYYGSIESEGSFREYFSRTSGTVWAVDLKGKPRTDEPISKSDGDITAIYAITERYAVVKQQNTLAAYQSGTQIESVYVLYDLADGVVRVIGFN